MLKRNLNLKPIYSERLICGRKHQKELPPAFDEYGRDYEERGLDDEGKPIQKMIS